MKAIRGRSPVAVTVATVTAALSAAVLVGCGPQSSDAAGKGKATATASRTTTAAPSPSATTGGPTTQAPATTAPPTTTAPTTAAPTTTAPATTKPPVPVVVSYGETSAKVRELQARLAQLHLFSQSPTGFYGAVTQHSVSDFQERHGLTVTGRVTEATWTKLRALTRTPTHKELYPVAKPQPAGKLDARCMTGRAMCVSKTSRTLSWVVDGKVLATMDVRFGSQYTPTREGLFHVSFKSRDHVSTIYHTAMPYAMFFSGGQAVHYSSDFAARGYAGASHGCVNVRDKAAIAALFDQVKVGDKVVVYW
ncbi:Peptidoglycan-binding (PGRP) domain of peptidoglycan hydrolases-containing protein [Actinacidiphila alni]|uniref:Peptidoglycan-binding (PGRP) domain of peptidoglycan hydrolases-containing protein n=1 Tax=Actinacidiphila alni TaxID=380248 RepID=A0A1I2DQB4_9ACTN|nr:L,D-transpeptidase family protein [Actinacidiphila alni]SFE82736.1 Peptidoglycan-binding (PGRP) domain of peptidoglycan hydrolases-containing protein [Actinacidiphila alni]